MSKKENSIEKEDDKKVLGMKRGRHMDHLKGVTTPHIDFRVKEDHSNNIKININISVNNNTSNTVNITSIGEKRIDDMDKERELTLREENKNFNSQNKPEKKIISPLIDNEKKGKNEKNEKKEKLEKIEKIEKINTPRNNSSILLSEADEEEEISDSKEELKEAISSLLFYKIEMPTSSSNKSILSALERIEEKLNKLKNCNIYTVKFCFSYFR